MHTTAESVTFAHPDKVCDQISDAILDACLESDPLTRAAVEVMGGHGKVFITGELTTNAKVDFKKIVNDVCIECGYLVPDEIVENIAEQSREISSGVDEDGAGDQGIMVGYATSETEEMLPKEFVFARRLTDAMGIRDGKAQVTLDKDGYIVRVLTSVSNASEENDVDLVEEIKKLNKYTRNGDIESLWLRNPNGTWTISGFDADAGLTGRKIVVDAYGPSVQVGGGAFSGKDATKVDRSAAYMARKIAVDYLKERNANEVKVQIAYAIGVSEPVMKVVEVDGKKEEIKGYDLRPSFIIESLGLRKPVFKDTARRGHFGRDYKWEESL